MAITLRSTKGSELTHAELDGNFTDLDTRVTAAQNSGYTVTQSDVTQHQGALSITQSQISDLTTYVSVSELKSVVSASTDFADFQARISAL